MCEDIFQIKHMAGYFPAAFQIDIARGYKNAQAADFFSGIGF